MPDAMVHTKNMPVNETNKVPALMELVFQRGKHAKPYII